MVGSIYNDMKASNVSVVSSNLQFGGLNNGTMVGVGGGGGGGALGNGHFENWGDSGVVADHSQQTDTSTDTDDKNQAYVQQLENSRLRLTQLEQELKRARQQGVFVTSGFSADQSHSVGGTGALAFDIDYARWLDEHQRLINDLRLAVNSHVGDSELRLLVDGVMSHYDEIFRLKSVGAKSDVFHMLSGMWKTPAERCFMWLGGFRCSEVLKADLLRQQTLRQLQRILTTRQAARALLAIGDYKSRLRALSSLWLARPKE
ncbi:UNVERIFIED_CONTAM: Transcription factor HBP-1b(c38) [Sesamum radiatum]|uniref:Transcription factor HBP-1b(C38) n=1 Tax=Sesamum radiatum TaxID=300843 RepID=A0AAW2V6W2_SESRA